jgi:hypothetical protein
MTDKKEKRTIFLQPQNVTAVLDLKFKVKKAKKIKQVVEEVIKEHLDKKRGDK